MKTGPTKNDIGVRIETQRLNWSTSMRMYQENISFKGMSIQELSDFHSLFKDYFRSDKEKLNSYLKSNRARIKINCYNNSELIEPTIVEFYISGTPESFVELFKDVPDEISEMFIQTSPASASVSLVNAKLSYPKNRFTKNIKTTRSHRSIPPAGASVPLVNVKYFLY
ncbi:hypothetical protein [Flavobacterium quisquiliarum]|uniref:Uncharacterized protein n=1 Tax=Flavobacterium quisquiliarum TaxID=1834436 RepID=A0ABV8WGJ2_9FLAO|nr:hypothetical protein [Flavobacterium quisquiliarum]MBW1656756.1 hypothetical protein [Flavobacterium quisquiliarum]NWL00382.1 hypothetical protein [Flavobacterium collinsii]